MRYFVNAVNVVTAQRGVSNDGCCHPILDAYGGVSTARTLADWRLSSAWFREADS